MTFNSLGLDTRILATLKKQGYTIPTPIQAQSIPLLLDNYDLLGTAQTGTGEKLRRSPFLLFICSNVKARNVAYVRWWSHRREEFTGAETQSDTVPAHPFEQPSSLEVWDKIHRLINCGKV